MKATLHTDGGANRRLGLAGIGVMLEDKAGEIVCKIARNIGRGFLETQVGSPTTPLSTKR